MKVTAIKKIFISVLLLSFWSSSFANNRYGSYEGQGRWTSTSITPTVEVYLKGSSIYAKPQDKTLDMPATRLKRVNSNLLNEYTEQFILLEDFNGDSYQDIGVLKSIKLGGNSLCYSIYEYQPAFYVYRSRASKTVCTN